MIYIAFLSLFIMLGYIFIAMAEDDVITCEKNRKALQDYIDSRIKQDKE